MVYEGKVHKCPNCGDLIDSFHAICPTCGYEIRNAKSSSVVREFAEKLELISSQRMPPFEEKRSIMKKNRNKKTENKRNCNWNKFIWRIFVHDGTVVECCCYINY